MSVLSTSSVVSGFGISQNKPTSDQILGKDDFLRLLVTQLNYQDPLEPMKSTDFSAQLAQFSSVEQLFNIDETLKASLDGNYLLAASINNTLAATVIGKEVLAYGDQLYFDGQQPVSLTFDLADGAENVKVEILDSNGMVKKTLQLSDLEAGRQSVSWDGSDSNGTGLASGTYQFRVSATDAEGNAVSAQTFTSGQISGVRYSQNGAVLMLGNLEISLSDVYEILTNNA